MRAHGLVLPLALLVAGCAAYTELSPDPELTPQERGYIRLADGDKNFRLDQGEKYYMEFPGPARKDMVLVLVTDKKWALDPLLTRVFDSGDGPGERIANEAEQSDSVMVYAVDQSATTYFWVVESVRADVDLTLNYRYTTRWRYTFETRYSTLRDGLKSNTVDRTAYNAIDGSYSFAGFDFRGERTRLDQRMSALVPLNEEVAKLEKLFPPDVVSSQDTAYQRFRELKAEMDDEIAFQQSYARVLAVFEILETSKGRPNEFLQGAPQINSFLKDERSFPPRIVSRVRTDVSARLPEAYPFFDRIIMAKTDVTPIVLKPPLEPVLELYKTMGQPVPRDLGVLADFKDRYNMEAGILESANKKLRRLETLGGEEVRWTSDTLYAGLVATATEVAQMVPQSQLGRYDRYGALPYVSQLSAEIRQTAARAVAFQDLYETARTAASSIAVGSWREAESAIRALHESGQFSTHPPVDAQKDRLVVEFEEEIAAGISRTSLKRAEEFAARHEMTLENVPALYADSAFMPVHRITFSSEGSGVAARRAADIQRSLDLIKTISFPEKSIRGIYREFTTAPNTRGVEKARAIVEHGKRYAGTDKQIRAIIDECNVEAPKWITKPKEYRRVFALPVTSNRQGTNDYKVRLQLQIPTDAQFPVYDVNLKLPREVADKAGSQQWYEYITINQKEIKNEGRFRITSPTAANGYESLVTPVQMDKAGKNILEIQFKYPGFRVFEISAMAQVPIIRKN
jgi:hypothetical protein